jgi:hypothetical protein
MAPLFTLPAATELRLVQLLKSRIRHPKFPDDLKFIFNSAIDAASAVSR